MPAPNEITVKQLLRLIGTPDCPLIVDVCTQVDHTDDPFLIPGSFRHAHTDLTGLKSRLAGAPCVVVCQKGLKLSQGVVAYLRSEGLAAEYLSGGMFAWRDHADALRIPVAACPALVEGQTLWVTRHRPKIDRIACPWLIRRFIDRQARFLFVAPESVMDVAERFGATAFDVEDAPFSHRGVRCTFDSLLDDFNLHSPALDSMADVIRAADTNTHENSAQAAGLLAVSVGLSRLYKDDTAQMEAGLLIYDALYRWARDGQNEGHTWPTGGGA